MYVHVSCDLFMPLVWNFGYLKVWPVCDSFYGFFLGSIRDRDFILGIHNNSTNETFSNDISVIDFVTMLIIFIVMIVIAAKGISVSQSVKLVKMRMKCDSYFHTSGTTHDEVN